MLKASHCEYATLSHQPDLSRWVCIAAPQSVPGEWCHCPHSLPEALGVLPIDAGTILTVRRFIRAADRILIKTVVPRISSSGHRCTSIWSVTYEWTHNRLIACSCRTEAQRIVDISLGCLGHRCCIKRDLFRKCRLRRLRVEFLENGVSKDQDILSTYRGELAPQTYRK